MRAYRLCAPVVVLALCLVPSTSLAWLDPASPDVTVVLNTADTQFDFGTSPNSGPWSNNHGSDATLKLSGWFSCTGLKFDLAAHRGKTVEEAELHLAKASADANFALVAATFNTDWQEANTCWRWKALPSTEWTFSHSDLSTATMGSFGSLVSYAYATDGNYGTYTAGGNTWIRARLDAALVQALMLDQYGLAVTDPRICYNAQYASPVYSKESGSAVQPRLYIKFAATTDTSPPGSVANLTAAAGQENGEVVLRFEAPADPQASSAFGYNVRYSTGAEFATATDIARWRIPRPRAPGTPQRVLLEGLTPGITYTFFVQAYDAAGNGSAVQSVTFAPPAIATPTLATGPFVTPDPAGKTIRTVAGVMRYWAASEVAKINPVTGNRIEDGYSGTTGDNYKKANAVWDAGTNTISLTACRNEVVGAQLILEKLGTTLSNIRVSISDLAGPSGGVIPASTSAELFLLHYVRSGSYYYPDAAIPLASPFPTSFAIPDPNHNATGKNQSVWMDLYVPKDLPAGDYTGTISVAANELASPVTVNLKVRVSFVTIPDYPTFLVDLNGYGNPWDFGDAQLTCLRYFQAAHKHRAMCNTLPYGQAGNVRPDRCPTLTGAGPTVHAADWTAFDTKYGRFFDGTAFTPSTPNSPYYGPGMNTPITHLYTTFFEAWPVHILDTTYGFDAAGQGGAYWNNLVNQFTLSSYTTFFRTMPDIYPAFPEGYKQGTRNVIADWFRHAHDKGWTKTKFQIYLNNKYYYKDYGDCPALWLLEECEAADDFRAVGFFHQLYREGQAQSGVTDAPWHFRIDISTRWSQHWGQLDNRINFQNVSSASTSWHWPQIKYRNLHLDEDKQEQWSWYGLATPVTSSGIGHSQVFLQQWSQGLVGGMQFWDNYQTSWTTANDLSTVYSGNGVPGFGVYEGPIFSPRIKMMRQAEQVIELLSLWADQPGLNKPLVRNSVYARYGSGTWDYSFSGWTENKLYQLRGDLVAQIELVFRRAGDITGDGRINVFDLQRMAFSWNKQQGQPGYDPACDLTGDNKVDVFDLQVLARNWNRVL